MKVKLKERRATLRKGFVDAHPSRYGPVLPGVEYEVVDECADGCMIKMGSRRIWLQWHMVDRGYEPSRFYYAIKGKKAG